MHKLFKQNNTSEVVAMKNLAKNALSQLKRPDLLETRAYINGEWIDDGNRLDVTDPGTDEKIAEVSHCDIVWVDRAVEAASAAFPAWRDLLPVQRGAILRKWAALIREHAQDLAVIMTAEQGKPLADSVGEIAYGANFIDWFAAEGERCYGRQSLAICLTASC